jgi:hypothetical protein
MLVLLAVPVGDAGAFGDEGIAIWLKETGALVPNEFTAEIEKVYLLPAVNSVISRLVEVPSIVKTLGPPEITYDVIGNPPLFAGAVQIREALPTPGVAVAPVTASGTDCGMKLTAGAVFTSVALFNAVT